MNKNSDQIERIKTGTQLGTTNFIVPAIDIFVAANPYWIVPWFLIKGFYGLLFDFQQEKINLFVQYLEKNKSAFTKERVESKEFQEGFVITFENYIRQRGEKRRKIIEQIFIDFTTEVDKESFELERLYRTSELISLESIRFLGFVLQTAMPHLQAESDDKKVSEIDLSESLGQFFEKDNNKSIHSEFFNNHLEYVAELTTLGLFANKGTRGITYDGGGQVTFGFTKFGYRFMRYVLNI